MESLNSFEKDNSGRPWSTDRVILSLSNFVFKAEIDSFGLSGNSDLMTKFNEMRAETTRQSPEVASYMLGVLLAWTPSQDVDKMVGLRNQIENIVAPSDDKTSLKQLECFFNFFANRQVTSGFNGNEENKFQRIAETSSGLARFVVEGAACALSDASVRSNYLLELKERIDLQNLADQKPLS